MKNNFFRESVLPHMLTIGLFFLIILIYFSATLKGKVLIQSDVIQALGTLKEASDYHDKTGEEILWSNTSFSGMPIWRGYNANLIGKFHYFITNIIPAPILLCFLGFIGFYILLLVFGLGPWLSFVGGIAYTFSSFNFISIEAGHINKVFDMALMAPVLAGLVLIYRGKYWTGAGITSLFLALHIFYGHLQITYYLLIMILFFAVAEFYLALREKRLKNFFISSAVAIACAIIAVAPNLSKLLVTSEYSKSTTRGGSELSAKKVEGGGLDKEYALSWSNGVMETMTILIPGFYGGSSNEELGQNSETFKAFVNNGYPKNEAKEYSKNMPLYWGDQPFTSGPVYYGAIVCFLFVLGLILVKGPLKWWIAAVSALSLMLSWGKNFEPLTDIFFYYIPLYNKFRSVTMILTIAAVTFPLLGFIAIGRILKGEIKEEDTIKGLKWSVIITGGLCLIFSLAGGGFFEFSADSDKQFPAWLADALKDDRAGRLRMDSLRSLFFIIASAGLIWAFIKNKIKALPVIAGLGFLILIDMWSIDKRYLNNDAFKFKTKNLQEQIFEPSSADQQILQDPDPNYRVINLTRNPFSDAVTSYYHKSIGGYSAIKLGRYQEMIENHLSKNNMAVLNMLNTKYFITQDEKTKQVQVQQNPGALGNAWFVNAYKVVKNADEEIKALENFVPLTTAILDKRFEGELKGLPTLQDVSGKIKEIAYHPNRLTYESSSDKDALAVFSEIYYQPGWQAYIDGKPVDHIRVNYILRGLKIPAGNHKIEFKFEPKTYIVGEKISLAGSIVLIVFLLLVFGREIVVALKKEEKV